MMRRKLWTVVALVSVSWISLSCQKVAVAGAPQIAFDKTVYDFGSTSLVQSVTGTFTFQNNGDAVLEVQKPVTSCGCTVAAVKPDKLQPGEKGELVFTLNVAAARGPVEKIITVPSNDPTNQQVRLSVKVDMHQLYDISPSVILLGDLPQGTQTNLTLVVKRTDNTNCVISQIEKSSDTVTTTIEPVADDPTQTRIVVALQAGTATRRIQEWVRIHAAGVPEPIATVYLHGRVVGDVSVQPETVYWSKPNGINWPGAAPDLMTKRKLEVTPRRTDTGFIVSNIVCSVPNVTVTVAPNKLTRGYTLVLQMTSPPTTNLNGTISFETNIPTQPRVVVPVTVNVLGR